MPFPGKGAVLIELSGRIAFASTYFCDLVGVEHERIASMSYFDFVHPDDLDEALKMFGLAKNLSSEPPNIRLRRIDGAVIRAEIHGTALKDAHGEMYAVSATVTAAGQAVTDTETPGSRPRRYRKPKSHLHSVTRLKGRRQR